MRSGELEGAIGVSGAPDNEQNAECAKAGVDGFAQTLIASNTREALARPIPTALRQLVIIPRTPQGAEARRRLGARRFWSCKACGCGYGSPVADVLRDEPNAVAERGSGCRHEAHAPRAR